MNEESRGNLYLLTGIVIGIALGLLIAWRVLPVQYVDTEPSALAEPYKDTYRKTIALAYQANHNVGRARERLMLIDKDNQTSALIALAQRMTAANESPLETRALAVLASDLNNPNPIVAAQPSPTKEETATQEAVAVKGTPAVNGTPAANETPVLPTDTLDPAEAIRTATVAQQASTPTGAVTPTVTVTRTPQPTFTPRPTENPLASDDRLFKADTGSATCERTLPPNLLQVVVTGADGQPAAGVRIAVRWQGGEDVFYTGLAPEISPGYADFKMQPGTVYTLQVGKAGELIKDIKSDGNCGWKIMFSEI